MREYIGRERDNTDRTVLPSFMMRSVVVDNEQSGNTASRRNHAWESPEELNVEPQEVDPWAQFQKENTRTELRMKYERSFPGRNFVDDYDRYATEHDQPKLDSKFVDEYNQGGKSAGIHPDAQDRADRLVEQGEIADHERQAALELISDMLRYNDRNPLGPITDDYKGGPIADDYMDAAATRATEDARQYDAQQQASHDYAKKYGYTHESPPPPRKRMTNLIYALIGTSGAIVGGSLFTPCGWGINVRC